VAQVRRELKPAQNPEDQGADDIQHGRSWAGQKACIVGRGGSVGNFDRPDGSGDYRDDAQQDQSRKNPPIGAFAGLAGNR
jgi:hypothetical protein